METDPTDASRDGLQQRRQLLPRDWAWLSFITLLMLAGGIWVIVAREDRLFPGRGPVGLDPVSAWVTDLAMIAGGLLVPVLAYVYTKRPKQSSGRVESALVRRIKRIDTLLMVSGLLTAVLACTWRDARAEPGQWPLVLAGVLATACTTFLVVRWVLEYRAGVSVHWGLRWLRPDYDRATRPLAFWWAMGIDMACLLLVAAAAGIIWVTLASG